MSLFDIWGFLCRARAGRKNWSFREESWVSRFWGRKTLPPVFFSELLFSPSRLHSLPAKKRLFLADFLRFLTGFTTFSCWFDCCRVLTKIHSLGLIVWRLTVLQMDCEKSQLVKENSMFDKKNLWWPWPSPWTSRNILWCTFHQVLMWMCPGQIDYMKKNIQVSKFQFWSLKFVFPWDFEDCKKSVRNSRKTFKNQTFSHCLSEKKVDQLKRRLFIRYYQLFCPQKSGHSSTPDQKGHFNRKYHQSLLERLLFEHPPLSWHFWAFMQHFMCLIYTLKYVKYF